MQASDVDAFFKEHDERMRVPLDDEQEYMERMGRTRRCALPFFRITSQKSLI